MTFPASAIARLQLTPEVAEPDDATPTLTLANEDLLVGTLDGKLKIDTAFDTITVNAAEIKILKHTKGGWPGRAGDPLGRHDPQRPTARPELACNLAGGVDDEGAGRTARLSINQPPRPQPAGQMVDRIKTTVTKSSTPRIGKCATAPRRPSSPWARSRSAS